MSKLRFPALLRSGILILVAAVISTVFIVKDVSRHGIFYGDALGYYLYLPSALIYNNLDASYDLPEGAVSEEWVLRYLSDQKTEGLRSDKGRVINQYTYGIAMMEAPFFLAMHGYLKVRGLPANGYSESYQLAVRFSTLFYGLLGLWLTGRILRRSFSPGIALLTILCLFLGTNLFWFMLHQAGMSHVPLFFLFALLIWYTIKVHEQPSSGRFLAIGLVLGLITIIRPTDIICLLIPVLYQVYDRNTARAKLEFIRRHWLKIAGAALIFLVPLIPQLIYWKWATGSLLFYSYGEQGFDWLHPRIIDGLLSGRNGWLIYSPIMFMALAGMFCYRKLKPWFWCLVVMLPLYCYIIYAWYCWNYINGLGSRPMVHLYALLALPFAAFLAYISRQRLWIRAGVTILSLFFMAVNYSYSMLQSRGLNLSEDSNLAFNTGMLFRTELRYKDLVAFDINQWQPDPSTIISSQVLAYENYENFPDSVSEHYVRDGLPDSNYVYSMGENEHHPNTLRVPYSKALLKGARWFKCSGRFMYPNYANRFQNHLLVLSVNRGGGYPLWKGCRIQNKIGIADSSCTHVEAGLTLDHQEPGRWGTAYFFVKVPGDLQDGDIIELDLWNIGKKDLHMDDIKLEICH